MAGVTIGDGAIIRTRAVVTKNVEPYSIVGGVPVKLIKTRFEKDVVDELLGIRWWDLLTDKISKGLESIRNQDIKLLKKISEE